jgi:hypothetical protein
MTGARCPNCWRRIVATPELAGGRCAHCRAQLTDPRGRTGVEDIVRMRRYGEVRAGIISVAPYIGGRIVARGASAHRRTSVDISDRRLRCRAPPCAPA